MAALLARLKVDGSLQWQSTAVVVAEVERMVVAAVVAAEVECDGGGSGSSRS